MASDPQPIKLGMQNFAILATTNQRLFQLLTETMGLQPRIDPDAGHGVLQIVNEFIGWCWDDTDTALLLDYVQNNAEAFYIVVRAAQFAILDQNELKLDLRRNVGPPSIPALVRDLVNVLPSFKSSVKPARKRRKA
jgi:hypothetical protein